MSEKSQVIIAVLRVRTSNPGLGIIYMFCSVYACFEHGISGSALSVGRLRHSVSRLATLTEEQAHSLCIFDYVFHFCRIPSL